MFLGKFIFFCAVIFGVFTLPRLKQKRSGSRLTLFAIPVFVALVLTGLTALKVYFLYKLFILLFVVILGALTLWSLKGYLKR